MRHDDFLKAFLVYQHNNNKRLMFFILTIEITLWGLSRSQNIDFMEDLK